MKKIKHLLLLAFTICTLSGFAQVTVTLQVSGLVTLDQTQAPVANHPVSVFVPDSLNGIFFYDSTFTGPDGQYVIDFPVQFTQGTTTGFSVSTPDCNGTNQQLSFNYTGNQTQYTADFSICADTINPPIGCDNFIDIYVQQSLTINFNGWVLNSSAASYLWDFGDGNTATGQSTTHTFPQNGSYIVTLQTITEDSCIDLSERLVILDDSLSNPCYSYFISSVAGSIFEIAFSGITFSPNPTTFQWEFGDGSTGTGENITHTYCCTGDYMVVLSTSDSLGCSNVYTSQITITTDTINHQTLTGLVFTDNTLLNAGTITLYKAENDGTYSVAQTSNMYNGRYYFYYVEDGTYLILATPAPDSLGVVATDYLPTYYGDVIMWDEATQIVLGVAQDNYNINLQHYDSIGSGNGMVNGQLLSGGKSLSTAHQLVYLMDATDTPDRVTYTDESGNFSFQSIPFGTFKVHPAITGMYTTATEIELSQNNTTANVVMTINGNTILGVNKPVSSMVAKLFPNPASNEIQIDLKQNLNAIIQIYNSNGALVFENEYSSNQIKIELNDFKPGIYYMNLLEPNGKISTQRFIKQ